MDVWSYPSLGKITCLFCNLILQKTNEVRSFKTNLCQHYEPYEKGDHSYHQDEELPTVFTAEGGGIHVHHGCHQALYTHKLMKKETRRVKYLYVCVHVCGCPADVVQKVARKQKLSRSVHIHAINNPSYFVIIMFETNIGILCLCGAYVGLTWLSSPRKTIIMKKKQAHRGEKGIMDTARG